MRHDESCNRAGVNWDAQSQRPQRRTCCIVDDFDFAAIRALEITSPA
jgi:hypothetical protein